MRLISITFSLVCFLCFSFCQNPAGNNARVSQEFPVEKPLQVGAERFDQYVPDLKNKNVGMVVNHTSVIRDTHVVDTLLKLNVGIKKIFAPEHGFRGKVDRGETVADDKDLQTGLPIVSLYGSQKKPSPEMLEGLDVLIFDIQDVGARFFTYISTMHYVMEACAENGKEVIILDRPNPNGDYVDGPVLDPEKRSFIGMHEIPIVHGMTVGELAKMINEEKWLKDGVKCDLTVISCDNYTHSIPYSLRIKPSPNLPNDQSILLYPTLCLFEGTKMSIGRGTTFPFQVLGYPDRIFGDFTFTPVSLEGWEKNPKFKDQLCYGEDWRNKSGDLSFSIDKLLEVYNKFPEKDEFFLPSFDLLAGNTILRQQIKEGLSADEIRATWEEKLNQFKEKRKKYLLYPES